MFNMTRQCQMFKQIIKHFTLLVPQLYKGWICFYLFSIPAIVPCCRLTLTSSVSRCPSVWSSISRQLDRLSAHNKSLTFPRQWWRCCWTWWGISWPQSSPWAGTCRLWGSHPARTQRRHPSWCWRCSGCCGGMIGWSGCRSPAGCSGPWYSWRGRPSTQRLKDFMAS